MLVQLSAGSQNFLLHANKQECSIRHCCLAPVTNYGLLTEPKFYIVKSALSSRAPLFHPLSVRKKHFLGVFQVGPAAPLWSEYAHGTTFHVGKKNYCPPKSKKWAVNFVISFIEVFSLIFTQRKFLEFKLRQFF